jgi:hypothetical protein
VESIEARPFGSFVLVFSNSDRTLIGRGEKKPAGAGF